MIAISPNAQLATLLRCLDRPDISTLELVSDELVRAVRASGTVPLSKTPLTLAHIESLLAGTPLKDALANNQGTPQVLALMFGQKPLRAVVHRQAGRVRVAIGHGQHEAPASTSTSSVVATGPERGEGPGIVLAPATPPPTVAQPTHQEPLTTPGLAAASLPGIDLGLDLSPRPAGLSPPASRSEQTPAAVLHRVPSPESHPAPAVTPPQKAERLPAPAGPAVQQLIAWVQMARDANASDMHLIPAESLRMRMGGALITTNTAVPASMLASLVDTLLTAAQRARLADVGYVDLACDLQDAGRVRINISRRPSGSKWCLRLVPLTVPTLQSLHLPEDLSAVAGYHQGLAIVSGPSGHGKTATLAALIDRINSHSSHHIILIEDPIEVVHPVRAALISQREVGSHTQSYARALKAALREDPDVIVVGELRDKETVEIALGAAETGHLVLATMKTRSAAKTIDRLIDLFPPEDQAQVRSTLAGSLKMVISQRLVPTAAGGQMPAVELLTGSVPLWALIRDNKLFQLPSLQQRGRSAGMIRLDSSLLELVQAGHVQPQVARGYAENPQEFDRLLAAAKPGSQVKATGHP